MESLFFLEEQIQNGLTFRLGQCKVGGDFLHWEPVTAPPKGDEAVCFRDSIIGRNRIFSRPGAVVGILPLTGPVAFQGKIWLGFEARGGKSGFEIDRTRVSLERLIRGLFPLIRSYASCHGEGISVGRPDWGRFFHDGSGFYMPDPFIDPFLPSPPCTPPAGFSACHPPEIYRGENYRLSSDLFFLGLILYYVITGALPYALRKGWPNENILAGAVIPPLFHRAELNPKLSEVMVNLLAADPSRRPPASWVAEVWEEVFKSEEYTVSKLEAASGVKRSRRLWRQQTYGMKVQKLWAPFRKRTWLMVAILVVFLVMALGWISPQPAPTALEYARAFYEEVVVVSGPMLGTMGEDPTGLIKDFELARKERLKIVTEVLSRPLARVDSMRLIEMSEKLARVEVGLTWWSWDGSGWKRSERREVLVIERLKKAWRVKERLSGESTKKNIHP